MKIISKKVNERICERCRDEGKIQQEFVDKNSIIIEFCSDGNIFLQCPKCEGTGKIGDNHYYHIDEKNKICFDGDSLK